MTKPSKVKQTTSAKGSKRRPGIDIPKAPAAPLDTEIFADICDQLIETIRRAQKTDRPLAVEMPYQLRVGKRDKVFVPTNFITGDAYTGINAQKLALVVGLKGLESGWFGTFIQWKKAGCRVKKGSKGAKCLRWLELTPEQARENEKLKKAGKKERHTPRPRAFTVFHASQVEAVGELGRDVLRHIGGLKGSLVEIDRKRALKKDHAGEPWYRLEALDRIQLGGVKIRISSTTKEAYYTPPKHEIVMPKMVTGFRSSADYYATLLHELVHSTWHMCGRTLGMCHESASKAMLALYFREELVAELGAWMAAARFGLFDYTIVTTRPAGYLAHFLKHLGEKPDYLRTLLADAARAADLVLSAAGMTVTKPAKMAWAKFFPDLLNHEG
jgi:antirestriction protein ArdC